MIHGIYCVGPEVGQQDAPGTVSGHIGIMGGEPRLVLPGKTVPALLGISFGVEWMPADLGMPFVSMKVTRPLPDGTIVTERWETDALPGQMKANFFTFDLPEELALGTWTFEAFASDELLWRVSFEVIDPLSFPNPHIACIGMVS